jgi:hypothetical protein
MKSKEAICHRKGKNIAALPGIYKLNSGSIKMIYHVLIIDQSNLNKGLAIQMNIKKQHTIAA